MAPRQSAQRTATKSPLVVRRRMTLLIAAVLIVGGAAGLVQALAGGERTASLPAASPSGSPTASPAAAATPGPTVPQISKAPNDFLIENLRKRQFPGSPIAFERVVADTPAFTKYAISYTSDALKITGLMAIPKQPAMAATGNKYPAIILNHGYYPTESYRPGNGTDREMDYLSARGYVTVAPDYRNHAGSSDFPDVYLTRVSYPVDVLNLVGSLKQEPRVAADRIGIWGHSMGGDVTQKAVAIRPEELKAVVVYGSLSATEAENREQIRTVFRRPDYVAEFDKRFGTPASAPDVYAQLSPASYHQDVTAPFSIHHGTNDPQVPFAWSVKLRDQLAAAGKPVEFFEYPNGPHIFQGQQWADFMNRINAFYDRHLKG